MKSVVVKCPASGENVRLMPGSTSLELYLESRKSDANYILYVVHMKEVHKRFLKEIGK